MMWRLMAVVFDTVEIVLFNTDPAASYDFVFTASRIGATDIRTADYQVVGANSGLDTLDASNNRSETAIVSGIAGDAQNRITVTVTKGATNNNSYGFFYLGTMEIRKNVP